MRYIPRHKRPPAAQIVVHVHNDPPTIVLPAPTEAPDPRRDLWCKVAVAVAQSSNATKPSAMFGWADAAVATYDERFK